ncbi:MAG: transcriptional regulator, partial [Cyanobacteria bacterium QH_6_48_35]
KVRLLHNMGELPSKYCHQVLDILVEMFSRK